jgi:hypothetical protein
MPPFNIFRPSTSLGTTFGYAVVLICGIVGGGLLYKGFSLDVGPKQIGPFVAGTGFIAMSLLFLYWTWSLSALTYLIDRNSLSIRWGAMRQIIPLTNIERLVAHVDEDAPSVEGINWMGHHVGKAEVANLGNVLFYSAHRAPSEILYVQTPTETYGLSVPDHVVFAEALQAQQARGPAMQPRQAVYRWGIQAQSFWQDYWARTLAVGLISSFIAVLAYVLQMYPDLGQSVALRFPSLVGVVRVTDKSALLDIPRSAAGFMAANLVLAILLHSWERMVAYVLLLAGIGVQVMLLVAAIVAVAQ